MRKAGLLRGMKGKEPRSHPYTLPCISPCGRAAGEQRTQVLAQAHTAERHPPGHCCVCGAGGACPLFLARARAQLLRGQGGFPCFRGPEPGPGCQLRRKVGVSGTRSPALLSWCWNSLGAHSSICKTGVEPQPSRGAVRGWRRAVGSRDPSPTSRGHLCLLSSFPLIRLLALGGAGAGEERQSPALGEPFLRRRDQYPRQLLLTKPRRALRGERPAGAQAWGVPRT